MNFGKGAQLVLAIGIFVVGAIFLQRMNAERQESGEKLAEQMETAQSLLPQLTAEREDYENQLTSLEAEMATVRVVAEESKQVFPNSAESIEYDEIIFLMAHDRDLEIVHLTASEPSSTSTGDINFVTTVFSISVRGKPIATSFDSTTTYREFIYGTVSDILDFINGIAIDEDFASATLDSAEISVPSVLFEAEITGMQETEEVDEIKVPTANIRLTVYSYEGN